MSDCNVLELPVCLKFPSCKVCQIVKFSLEPNGKAKWKWPRKKSWLCCIWNDTIWLMVSTPLKNISQLGLLFPIYGKIKNVPNHQTAITMNRLPQKAEKTPRPCNWWPHSSHRSLQALLSSLVVAFQACELLQSRSHGHLVYHGLSLSVPHSNFGCPKPVPQFLKSTDFPQHTTTNKIAQLIPLKIIQTCRILSQKLATKNLISLSPSVHPPAMWTGGHLRLGRCDGLLVDINGYIIAGWWF